MQARLPELFFVISKLAWQRPQPHQHPDTHTLNLLRAHTLADVHVLLNICQRSLLVQIFLLVLHASYRSGRQHTDKTSTPTIMMKDHTSTSSSPLRPPAAPKASSQEQSLSKNLEPIAPDRRHSSPSSPITSIPSSNSLPICHQRNIRLLLHRHNL